MTEAQARSDFDAKVRRGMFRPIARRILGPDAEDRLQDGTAQTYEYFLRKYRQGVIPSDPILVHHCRLRATDLGRHVVRRMHSRRDALDPRNYRDGRVEILHLDGIAAEPKDQLATDGDRDLSTGIAEQFGSDPTRRLISALDLEAWLAELCPSDRRLLALRYEGQTLTEIASAMDIGIGKVFSRLRSLGFDLAERCGAARVETAGLADA